MKLTLQYGFELEGAFLNSARKILGVFKGDGSVDVNPPSDVRFEQCGGHEFESPVYPTKRKLFAELAKFKTSTDKGNGKGFNHFWNYTAGLHFNISAKTPKMNQMLMQLTGNWDFIQQLQDYALTFCEHQKYRLQYKSGYCQRYQNERAVIQSFQGGSKSVFLRYHPENRLEFRFLSPCEHKLDNVKKTLAFLVEYLQQDETVEIEVPLEPSLINS